ncbi:MAG: RNA methyltransferase [Melioribacteraceae bacterium]|nr:RNA methyltransferase [Melioribacteraceae bacterium]MCF8354645.1 RNA methyltransferase [Melioribacteraceae bacterium]MCF8394180.1 RNA methyltransferase [Melioribacteraceae bacterium]MCF8418863.1 RNA methyltransferase [Melioribacteraceae bacterium]
MREFKSENRLKKIISAVNARQPSLNLVLENIHDKHNVSAILRSCDAVGINNVSLVYNVEKFPKLNNKSSVSASALKWLEIKKYKTIDNCYNKLRENGFKIYASLLDEDAVDLYSLDLTQKVALVVGNEHRGISDEAAELADETFYIPMRGMIQSLNVSVACAVSLYEAQRQRSEKGMYDNSEMPKDQLEKMIDDWCRR